jgi:hypothetical protein
LHVAAGMSPGAVGFGDTGIAVARARSCTSAGRLRRVANWDAEHSPRCLPVGLPVVVREDGRWGATKLSSQPSIINPHPADADIGAHEIYVAARLEGEFRVRSRSVFQDGPNETFATAGRFVMTTAGSDPAAGDWGAGRLSVPDASARAGNELRSPGGNTARLQVCYDFSRLMNSASKTS